MGSWHVHSPPKSIAADWWFGTLILVNHRYVVNIWKYMVNIWTFMNFYILGIIIPTGFHIFQKGRYTTNQLFLTANDVFAFIRV